MIVADWLRLTIYVYDCLCPLLSSFLAYSLPNIISPRKSTIWFHYFPRKSIKKTSYEKTKCEFSRWTNLFRWTKLVLRRPGKSPPRRRRHGGRAGRPHWPWKSTWTNCGSWTHHPTWPNNMAPNEQKHLKTWCYCSKIESNKTTNEQKNKTSLRCLSSQNDQNRMQISLEMSDLFFKKQHIEPKDLAP